MFVNIVDLIDTPVTQGPIVHFKSEEALSEYTKSKGKYFPAHSVHAGGLLKFLLRKIDDPRKLYSSQGRRGVDARLKGEELYLGIGL